MSNKNISQPEVAAIITAMTDSERLFVRDTIESVFSDPGIGQVVLCIEAKNTWIDTVLGSFSSDPRLKVIKLPLMPLGAVRNQALKQVQMPWVAYCDGDDVWCPGKTQIQLTYAKATGCDFVGADHYLTNEKGLIRAVSRSAYLPMPSSWMVRAEIMRQHPFDESPFSLGQEESGEWWMRTSGVVSKARCPKLLLRYRIRANSLSAKTPSMRYKAKIVSLANIPGLGSIIYFSTWFLWLCNRQETYLWHKDWQQQPVTVLIGE
jgi:glycosyltransferase involved in cell wall biosynthesis